MTSLLLYCVILLLLLLPSLNYHPLLGLSLRTTSCLPTTIGTRVTHLGHADVADGDGDAHHLLHLELDRGAHLCEGEREGVMSGDEGRERHVGMLR